MGPREALVSCKQVGDCPRSLSYRACKPRRTESPPAQSRRCPRARATRGGAICALAPKSFRGVSPLPFNMRGVVSVQGCGDLL